MHDATAPHAAHAAAPHTDNTAGFAPPEPASLQLGLIGNCGFSGLVDKRGRIVWCCMPRFDGDPVFNALLQKDDEASAFSPRSRRS